MNIRDETAQTEGPAQGNWGTLLLQLSVYTRQRGGEAETMTHVPFSITFLFETLAISDCSQISQT